MLFLKYIKPHIMSLNLTRQICLILFIILFAQSELNAQTPKNVLIIGIDGLRGDAFMSAKTPNFGKIMNAGEYSFDADMGAKTNCATGWSSLLTGVWYKKHNVKDESFKKNLLVEYPHFYSLLKADKNIRTASIVNYEHITSHIDCCSDIMLNSKNDNAVKEKTIELIRLDKADVFIANFHELDEAGQVAGFNARSKPYVHKIQKADTMIVDILTAVQSHAKKRKEEWMLIITTEHGGEGTEFHGQHKLQQVRFAPQIVAFISEEGKIEIELEDYYMNLNDASLVNIVPTVLDYLSIDKPIYLDGNSYLKPLEYIDN